MRRERFKLDEGEKTVTPAGVLVKRLAGLAWHHKLSAIGPLLATIAVQLLVVAGAAVQGLAINVVQYEAVQRHGEEVLEGVNEGGVPRPDWPLGITPPTDWSALTIVSVLGGVILLIALAGGLARFFQRVADEDFAQACLVDLRTRLYGKLQSLGFTFFDDHDSGQIIQRVTQDVHDIRMFLQGVMVQAVISLVSLAVFLAYMLSQSVTLTLSCMVFIPIQIIAVIIYARVSKPKFKHHSHLVDKVVQFYKESIEGVKVIRVFGKQRAMTDQFDDRSATARDYRIEIARLTARTIPLLMTSQVLTQAVLLGVGGWLVLRNIETAGAAGITLGVFWSFYVLVRRFGTQVETIVMVAAQSPTALAGADRVFRLLDADPDVANPAEITPVEVRGRVSFEDVSFGYDPDEKVLEHVSFTVEPGETVAVVGETGSGKSTLLSLIARFYDPDEGRVLIDGVDLRAMDLRTLRQAVGFVFQEPFLFSNTVRNNIAFGVPAAEMEEVMGASNAAAAREFIEELDENFETVIGERGVTLSGGQRQRLSLARALVLNPSILVLDDATGAVDAITESQIQEHLERTLGERTTFIVAHRLSTLRRADRIIVLERGRIIDQGTHDELMTRDGHYKSAALLQLALEEEDKVAQNGEAQP